MNQADILKLAEEAGFESYGTPSVFAVDHDDNVQVCISSELTRFAELVAQHEAKVREELIELAKAQGAEEERNKYNDFIERLRQIPMVEPASADTELNELVEMFDAIRNRERKE